MLSVSWFAVLIPVWVGCLIMAVRGAVVGLRARTRRKAATMAKDGGGVAGGDDEAWRRDRATDEDADAELPDGAGQVLFQQTAAILPMLLFFLLLAARLDGASDVLSLASVLSPLFAVCGLAFCGTCCFVVCVTADLPEGWEDEAGPPPEAAGAQRSDTPEIVIIGLGGEAIPPVELSTGVAIAVPPGGASGQDGGVMALGDGGVAILMGDGGGAIMLGDGGGEGHRGGGASGDGEGGEGAVRREETGAIGAVVPLQVEGGKFGDLCVGEGTPGEEGGLGHQGGGREARKEEGGCRGLPGMVGGEPVGGRGDVNEDVQAS